MAVINYPLHLTRMTDCFYHAINEAKTIVQCCPFLVYCISILLKLMRVQQLMIPACYLFPVSFVNEVGYFVGNHANLRNWTTKQWNKVAVSTRVAKSS